MSITATVFAIIGKVAAAVLIVAVFAVLGLLGLLLWANDELHRKLSRDGEGGQ